MLASSLFRASCVLHTCRRPEVVAALYRTTSDLGRRPKSSIEVDWPRRNVGCHRVARDPRRIDDFWIWRLETATTPVFRRRRALGAAPDGCDALAPRGARAAAQTPTWRAAHEPAAAKEEAGPRGRRAPHARRHAARCRAASRVSDGGRRAQSARRPSPPAARSQRSAGHWRLVTRRRPHGTWRGARSRAGAVRHDARTSAGAALRVRTGYLRSGAVVSRYTFGNSSLL